MASAPRQIDSNRNCNRQSVTTHTQQTFDSCSKSLRSVASFNLLSLSFRALLCAQRGRERRERERERLQLELMHCMQAAYTSGVSTQGPTNSPFVKTSSATVSCCCRPARSSKYSDYRIIRGLAVTVATHYLRLTCFFSPSSQSGESCLLLLVLRKGKMSLSNYYLTKIKLRFV